ncbi:peptidoglycan DD-metalloendopeptidase family protein [Chloroflexota bacterium]
MIESHTDLPSQEGGPATAWARGRQAGSAIIVRAQRQVQQFQEDHLKDWTARVHQFGSGLTRGDPLRIRVAPALQWLSSAAGDEPLLNRYALHLIVVLLAVGVVAISQITLPEIDLTLPDTAPAPDPVDNSATTLPSNRGVNREAAGNNNDSTLFSAPVFRTARAERDTMEVFTYTVQPNDNLWVIASGFGLQVETVAWANPEVEKAPDLLSVGQVLVILPVDGIVHTVLPGDTLKKLAKDYKSTVEKIVGFEGNELAEAPYVLTPGTELVIPGGRKQVVPWQKIYPMTWVGAPPKGAARGSGRFAWPGRGTLTQGFWSAHLAVDIANRTGVPIYAADAGYVRQAGQDTWGYGNQVVIDHGNGFVTRYAHLDTIKVRAGQSVQKNEQIGTMGNTGRSTGPHLHFEVIQNGVKRNPLGYLP